MQNQQNQGDLPVYVLQLPAAYYMGLGTRLYKFIWRAEELIEGMATDMSFDMFKNFKAQEWHRKSVRITNLWPLFFPILLVRDIFLVIVVGFLWVISIFWDFLGQIGAFMVSSFNTMGSETSAETSESTSADPDTQQLWEKIVNEEKGTYDPYTVKWKDVGNGANVLRGWVGNSVGGALQGLGSGLNVDSPALPPAERNALPSGDREETKDAMASAAAPATVTATAELVNVNTATVEELTDLPGIGQGLAERVVAYRDENGPFADEAALKGVSGVGDALLASIRDLIEF